MRFHRGLFFKIFVSFFLTQTIFISYLAWRAQQMRSTPGPLWQSSAVRTLPLVADSAVKQYETGGMQALEAELASRAQEGRFGFWLLDSSGRNLTSKPLEDRYAKPARDRSSVTGPQVVSLPDNVVELTYAADGQRGRYQLVGVYQTVSLLRGSGLLRLVLISTALSCITCLLLAHYLTDPIAKLRKAARKLATGDMDARAGESLGNRSDEIADLVRDFDRMAGRIRELLQSHKQLLSDVSHELRSPLARLRVAIALSRRNETQEQQASHERIVQEISRLDELIGRILTLARLESGQLKLPMAEISLDSIIQTVVSDAQFETTRTGHKIEYTGDSEARVWGNQELLHSAIENVVRNALYYSAGSQPIEIQLSIDRGQVLLVVRDYGPGVPEAAVGDLFKPFYRLDDSRVSSTGGAGLGLAIAERAVALHHGAISARNVNPPGLLVEIRIPQLAVDRGVVPAPALAHQRA